MFLRINNTTQNAQRKQVLTAIALIVLLTTSVYMTTLSPAAAYDRPTYAFLSVAPSPIGVGQTGTHEDF